MDEKQIVEPEKCAETKPQAMSEERKYAILLAATLLSARKLVPMMEEDRPNLAREMTLTALHELWVADITYIRLLLEFVYLAVILDAFSRWVIGWALDRTLEAELTLQALRMALGQREPTPVLVHHSDRGVQYASRDYTDLLHAHGIRRISMSRKGNPYDNAVAESFLKTLKYEEVYRGDYRDLAEARAGIGPFLEKVYNERRLHSALGYLPPASSSALCGWFRAYLYLRSNRMLLVNPGPLHESSQARGRLSLCELWVLQY